MQLHPALLRYFSAVPRGSVGIGTGVFERVGTRKRWLWPFLRVMQRHGAVYAGWHENVPFTVRNRTIAGKALSVRTLQLPDGKWVMKDAVHSRPHGTVVDQIGDPTTLAVAFTASVDKGAYVLRSTTLGLRWRRLRLRVPAFLAPVVRLRESAEKLAGRQRVALTVDMPLLGRLYEYEGTFEYRIEEETS